MSALVEQSRIIAQLQKAGLSDGMGMCSKCGGDVFETVGTEECIHVHRQAQGLPPESPNLPPSEPPEDPFETVPYPTTHRGGNGTERSAFTPDGSVPDRTGNDPERYGTDQPPLWFDVAGMLDNGIPEPPRPTICRRSDGVGLFYPGQVCNLFGDPESGKTWLGLAAVTETLAEEEPAAVLDLDHNGPEQTINRLLQLGADPEMIRDPELFRYVEPEDKAHLLAVVRDACQWRPVFVLLDSVGELLPTLGLNSANPDDYTQANTAVMKPLARAGACVVTLDHLAKNSESRAMGATGTTAKKRAIGGTSLRVAVHEPFTPGRGGSAYLTINKDRPGGLREFCPQEKGEPYAGLFQLTEDGDGMHWSVVTPADAPSAPPVSDGPGSKGGMTEDEALAKLRALPESERPKTNEEARKLLGCRNLVASAAMRIIRSEARSGTVPDSHPYVGNGTERSCTVCGEPLIGSDPAVTTHPNCDSEEVPR